ncbi:MAG: C4-type zinc ribbon domain-containing protein [Candidatus Omnitrophica bacterium]|nr:C4-type zinc ribbon domain-containing protein [Candidatus Omnitrophota bacterium]
MSNELDIPQQTEFLIKLQDIDIQIYKMKAELDDRPGQIVLLKASLESKKLGVKKAEDNLKALQLEHKGKEVSLGSKESEIKKLEAQLYQIKTNKEYTAMINEIGSRKADNSLLEEEIINLMDTIDQAKKTLESEKEKFSQESKKTEEQTALVEKDISNIKSDIEQLNAKRQQIVPLLDGKLLAEYERILLGRDGQALARIVNGACGGCYMHMPSQVINEIKMKQAIIKCENCQRMLYITDEEDKA